MRDENEVVEELEAEEVKGTTVDVDVILNDLETAAEVFFNHVQTLKLLQENGFFKYVSKATRNETLMEELLSKSREIEEMSKIAFRSLKKVKRERVPDSVVDQLLLSSVTPLTLKGR
jgi:hypothetical protein